jgi:diguanylate cyclase (GGDEF)-like protein/PAS domain S-box-containing protein
MVRFAVVVLALSWVHRSIAMGQPIISITEAIRTTTTGAAVHERQTVTVQGVASVGTGIFYGVRPQKIFIQDDAAGLALFSRDAMPAVRAGDRVRATGTIKRYNGAFEVEVRNVQAIEHGAAPQPIAVQPTDLLSRKYSGRLVQITSTVVGSARRGDLQDVSLKAGQQVLVVHLTAFQSKQFTNAKSLFDDGAKIRVTGIASQYDREPPYDSGWQILPRAPEDVTLVRGAPLLTLRELLAGAGSAAAIIIACMTAVVFLRQQVAREREKVTASEARYRTLFERSVAGLYTMTADGKILDCNDAVALLLGCSREEVIGRFARDFYRDPQQLAAVVRALRERGSVSDFEIALRRGDGGEVWVLATATIVEAPGSDPLIDGAMIDITDRRRADEQMEFMAYHDAMTGLPNRALFRDHVELQMEQAHRESVAVAVLFLDLDRFKRINDSLGHSAGDELLQGVATRLREMMRGGDTVARLGGDEFAILARVNSVEAADTVARKVLSAIQQPFDARDHVLHITASIGVAIHPADGNDCETLLKNADLAMYRAKDSGRNTIEFASSIANAGLSLDRLSLENDLRRAMQNLGLEVWFQPQVSAMTGAIVGAEALARWFHPDRGAVSPSEFIPIAEDIGAIDALGEWVLEQACHACRSWQPLDRSFTMSVNVSANQLRDERFPERVASILSATGVSPCTVELEVTESAALSKQPHTLQAFSRLRDLGLRISIDDFGTGHATFTNVRQLPVSTIKIDASFVSRIDTEPNDATIVSGLIDMAHNLSCRVVAEGVENDAQLAFLRSRNCDAYQGFLFSRAIPANDFERLLVAQRGAPQAASSRR